MDLSQLFVRCHHRNFHSRLVYYSVCGPPRLIISWRFISFLTDVMFRERPSLRSPLTTSAILRPRHPCRTYVVCCGDIEISLPHRLRSACLCIIVIIAMLYITHLFLLSLCVCVCVCVSVAQVSKLLKVNLNDLKRCHHQLRIIIFILVFVFLNSVNPIDISIHTYPHAQVPNLAHNGGW